MMASGTRIAAAIQLRDASLRILSHIGRQRIIANPERGYFHRVNEARISGLTIWCTGFTTEQMVDIWEGRKVFSIRWNVTRAYLVAFRSGTWQRLITNADIEFTLQSVKCSAGLKRWLIGNSEA
ncbi:hypothetical protein [Bradyrhizobium sp. CER78]|uniref:hypothetical protein n=1 Tax=Bradyrhizobium sp. CER78 TaxID=3039162 RepID=UPI00244A4235|nr:hypothetical protein [Bradyrhizobium sp. CER78]MDH2386400.1 hypothetical protein [Bradyrhizobium sp. CER78]